MGMILKELGRTTAYITGTAAGTANTLVTNAASLDTTISHVVLYNSHSVAIVVTLCTVPDAAAAVGTADANDIYWSQSVPAGDTYTVDIPVYLTDTNDTLQVYAATADKVNAYAFGFTQADQS